MVTAKTLTAEQHRYLLELLGPERYSTGQSNLDLHRQDISPHVGAPPAGIVWPLDTGEVASLLAWTYREEIPVTPWGAGTSTEGNPLSTTGGLILDMSRMDRVLAVRPEDLQVDVEPGIRRKELNRVLSSEGLFFPIDPGADATIGGMVANNASGVQSVKYGATKDYVLRMQFVLPDGRIIKTGCRARKSSSGYDLTRFFVGSEGTLGVMTEATLRLSGIPEHRLAVTVPFSRLDSASEAVAMLMAAGLEPAALELMTEPLLHLMNEEKGLGLAETPTLFCEFHGVSKGALMETMELAQELCRDCGAADFRFGISETERRELWRARHDAWETIHRAHPGKKTLIVDVAVPISNYPEIVRCATEQVASRGVTGYVFGHAGDGNLHVVMVGDPDDPREWGALEAVNEYLVEQAVALDGTCTGEHGIGIGKRRFMELEHGAGYSVMKQLKDVLDPKGLMNPGKIFL